MAALNKSFGLRMWVVVFSVLVVFSHWAVWEQWVFGLGLNHALAWGGLWCLLIFGVGKRPGRADVVWFAPLWLMALSFVVWENPWTKTITFLLLPLATGLVYALRRLPDADRRYFDLPLLLALLGRASLPLFRVRDGLVQLGELLRPLRCDSGGGLAGRLLSGFALLLPLAAVAIVLLSSADAAFAAFVDDVWSGFWRLWDFSMVGKLLLSVLLSGLVLAMLSHWNVGLEVAEGELRDNSLDSVAAAVVLAGMLLIYLVFLWFQRDVVAISHLPAEFSRAETVVKSGFWQLFFLSVLNALMFFRIYRNTVEPVQWLLRAFVLASGLILLSAAWRMGLYVTWYGLSYEKFFASYTALYALVVFGYLLVASFAGVRKDVFRFIALSSLWFYSVATVLPIEKIIFHSNIRLHQMETTRIDLYHLSWLSGDVLPDVRAQIAHGGLSGPDWQRWVERRDAASCGRVWYQLSVSRLLACPAGE